MQAAFVFIAVTYLLSALGCSFVKIESPVREGNGTNAAGAGR